MCVCVCFFSTTASDGRLLLCMSLCVVVDDVCACVCVFFFFFSQRLPPAVVCYCVCVSRLLLCIRVCACVCVFFFLVSFVRSTAAGGRMILRMRFCVVLVCMFVFFFFFPKYCLRRSFYSVYTFICCIYVCVCMCVCVCVCAFFFLSERPPPVLV